jgi:resuscitation-promoting factor RpfB
MYATIVFMKTKTPFLVLLIVLLGACSPAPTAPKILVTVRADGISSNYEHTEPITIGEFLQQIELQLGELDDINPPEYTQISNNMVITVTRVQEETYTEDRDIQYERIPLIDETLPRDSKGVVVKGGVNGKQRIQYRVEIRDGVRGQPMQIGDPVILEPAQDEIIAVPPATELDPVEISGTIAYISKGNAWVMRGSNELPNRRNVTHEGDLDARVFSLSADGKQLLFSRNTGTEREFSNELWMLADVTAQEPQTIKLRDNVLNAQWFPGEANTITYSRADPRGTVPYYDARNDLWKSLIDPITGEEIRVDPVVDEYSGGLDGWFGTEFMWSPDGEKLACVEANGIGIVDFTTRRCIQIVNYPVYTVFTDWSWRTGVSWSPDGDLLATTVHGEPPSASFSTERSPVFNIALVSADGTFNTELIEQAGIWSNPSFSPFIAAADSMFPKGYMAYMLSRQPLDSVNENAEYDLYVADRDGSNARRLFPPENQRGIVGRREYVWSPDGRQIAIVYQGNLWILDVESGLSRQVTLDGSVSHPVWTR